MIPYGRQLIDADDIDAVTRALSSDYLTQGPMVGLFEDVVRDYVGAAHAVAVNSATSGLHIACLALGVSCDDVVWTSSNSFVASANCVRMCGARVDFVDVDPSTGNLCPLALEKKLEMAVRTSTLPKAIIPVHFSGRPCDMEVISALCRRYGIKIIEDASHAVGASFDGDKIGSCKYSDVAVFSFHPVKIITSAEGGMVMTNDDSTAATLRKLASHGIERDSRNFLSSPDGNWVYEQQLLGYNYRLSDLHAALGVSQMAKLDSFLDTRRRLVLRYLDHLGSRIKTISLPSAEGFSDSSWHLFVVLFENATQRKRAFNEFRDSDFGVQVHYLPIHLQPYYSAEQKSSDLALQNTEDFCARCLSLPLYPGLTQEEQDSVCEKLVEIEALFS